jgi:hypothetical protein
MRHREPPAEVNGRPAFDRLCRDPALADRGDPAVQLILELLAPDDPPAEPSQKRREPPLKRTARPRD